jgi:hypothetical protein
MSSVRRWLRVDVGYGLTRELVPARGSLRVYIGSRKEQVGDLNRCVKSSLVLANSALRTLPSYNIHIAERRNSVGDDAEGDE